MTTILSHRYVLNQFSENSLVLNSIFKYISNKILKHKRRFIENECKENTICKILNSCISVKINAIINNREYRPRKGILFGCFFFFDKLPENLEKNL